MALSDVSGKNKISIIPEPVSAEVLQGSFLLNGKTGLVLVNAQEARNSADFFKGYLRRYYSFSVKEVGKERWIKGADKEGRNTIVLAVEQDSLARIGAYTLLVTPDKIVVTGKNEQGLFYGVQTLLQLLPVAAVPALATRTASTSASTSTSTSTSASAFTPTLAETLEIPCVKIEDEPRFEYRGMHLDVVRHIFSVEYLKKYIDYLALHKMNYFHWHLTDDQGWRMECKSHPELNEKGAYRDATIIGIFPGTGVDSTRYGGYYTIEQLKEVVDYAARRYITVVPEIDIPGHSMAILAAYPQFGTQPQRAVKPAITWGIFNRENNVLAPSDEVFVFLEDVFNELMDIFPGKYIHMGADECAHKWWKESAEVQQFIKEHHLKDEKGLQKYFAQKVSDVITARNRVAVGWDEMVDNGLIDNVAVMSWRNEKGAYKAAKQGHKAILTPSAYSYLNYKQKEKEDSLCHTARLVSLDKVYKFEPVPDSLSTVQAANILGGGGCMWTEYFPTVKRVEYAIFPRMSAIAEVYWSDKKLKNWPLFLLKLPAMFDRYDLWGANYSSYIFDYECFPRK
ncbi:MAG: beta-N-acetylhexosaminidase [Bacteroidales bacterium]